MRCEINTFTAFAPCYHPRGYSRFQVTGMFEWGQKSKPKKFPWASNKTPKKSLDQNLTPQKFHAEFLCHKNFQKALNGVTRKLETLVLNSQKILYLNQATQKITCQNFPTQKISKTKISNPKNPLMILVTWNSKYPPPPPGLSPLALNTLTVTHWPFEGIPFQSSTRFWDPFIPHLYRKWAPDFCLLF